MKKSISKDKVFGFLLLLIVEVIIGFLEPIIGLKFFALVSSAAIGVLIYKIIFKDLKEYQFAILFALSVFIVTVFFRSKVILIKPFMDVVIILRNSLEMAIFHGLIMYIVVYYITNKKIENWFKIKIK